MTTTVAPRFRLIRTYSEPWLQRHQDTHSRHAEFGTHRHPYLSDLIEAIAAKLTSEEKPSLLDYGCGKGAFLHEMTRSGRFRFTRGHDPAVAAFKVRPSQVYDLVVCLDVLDQAEDEFVDPIIEDVAQFTGRVAVFDVITVQTPRRAHLNPRSAAQWRDVIGRRMRVNQTIVRKATAKELQEGACPERAIFVVSPIRDGEQGSRTAAGDVPVGRGQTFSPSHLDRQQQAHATTDGYGRHRHLYLHETMRQVAAGLRQTRGDDDLSWLDYGCGKGGFIGEIAPFGLFARISGFDPAVAAFAGRPEGRFDLVTCLDVLDTVEPAFLDNVLADIAALTGGLAVFDCLTRPKAGSRLRPHPPAYWRDLVGRHMKVVGMKVEFPRMESFERVVVSAEPMP